MELKIRNGDYVICADGTAQQLSGSAELVQRVLYKLTARREGFPFIPELGSNLYQLERSTPRDRAGAAEQAVREALSDEENLEITAVTLTEAEEGLYTLQVHLTCQGQTVEVALTIQ